MSTLLEKAKAAKEAVHGRPAQAVTPEDVELFYAYIYGEVTQSNVVTAKGWPPKNRSVFFYAWFHAVARTQRIVPPEEKP